jgi:hypothetical protein
MFSWAGRFVSFRRKSEITLSRVVGCHRTGCDKLFEKVVPDDSATVHAT